MYVDMVGVNWSAMWVFGVMFTFPVIICVYSWRNIGGKTTIVNCEVGNPVHDNKGATDKPDEEHGLQLQVLSQRTHETHKKKMKQGEEDDNRVKTFEDSEEEGVELPEYPRARGDSQIGYCYEENTATPEHTTHKSPKQREWGIEFVVMNKSTTYAPVVANV